MALALYSTLARKKEILEKKPGETIGLYSCGPTVYHTQQIGNMRSFVFSDILGRTLRFFHPQNKIVHIMNITDVGHLAEASGADKVEEEAKRQRKTASEIAALYTEEFMTDLRKLNVETAKMEFPRATNYIEKQKELIEELEKKGLTYAIDDGLYFDTAKDPHYGELVGLHGVQVEAVHEKNPNKKNPADFALWRLSPKNEKRQQEWPSKWGTGFPGWHIECSAMSMSYLGESFDLHTGGIDLIFPHHTNEIAQSENVTEKRPFVKIWMHNGFVNMKGDKMGKSKGNVITVHGLEELGYSALAYRFFLLSTHYRKPIEWGEEAMSGAQNSLEKLHERYLELGEETGKPDGTLMKKFEDALSDDLNTPVALSLIWGALEGNAPAGDKKATLLEFDKVLGLGLSALKKEDIPNEVRELVEERENARKEKNWGKADELRGKIEKTGYSVRDAEGGPIVRKASGN